MAGTSNITGDESILFADNASFDGTERGGKMITDGQLWIGATSAPHVRLGTLIAGAGTTITPGPGTITISASATGDVQTLTGNTGIATPIGGTINVVTDNATVKFVGTSGNLTQDFSLSNLILGTEGASITSAASNTGLGQFALLGLTSGSGNTCIGTGAGLSITSSINNTLIGAGAGDSVTTGIKNVALGGSTLGSFTSGAGNAGSNIAIGYQSLNSLTTGVSNIAIGSEDAGGAYTTSETNNIVINNTGVVGESNTTRIGTAQTRCFLAGILNTSSGRVVKITTPGAYPYTALTTDYMILVDTASARTINLMATPTTGTTLVIKDNVGSAGANNITITPNAGNIDGLASYAVGANWASATIVYNGTQWNVI